MDFTNNLQQTVSSLHHRPILKKLDAVLVWGTRLLVLLVPLLVLPWTFEIFEFNKQLLMLGLGVLLFAIWVVKVVIGREVEVVKSPLNWALLAFFVVAILATIFSVDKITSVLGFYGRFNGSLASIVSYLLLFILVRETSKGENTVSWLLGAWLTGIGVGAMVLFLQLLGVHTLPIPAAQLASFSLLGRSLNAIVIVLAASFPLALFFARSASKLWLKILNLAFCVLIAALAFMIDYQLGWISLLIATVAWLALIFWKNEAVGFQWTILPSIALIIALIGWPLVTPALTGLPIPAEVNLSNQASWKIAYQNASSNPLLGTGPETFIYGFSKYKPDNFNDSDFWAFRFDKASSELAQTFGTMGYLGLASYLAVLLVGFYLVWRLLHHRNHSHWYLSAAISTSYLVLVVGTALYFSSTVLAAQLWFTLGLLAVLSSTGNHKVSLTSSPRASFSFSFGLAVVVLLAIVVCYGVGRVWAADLAYAKSQVEGNKLETLDAARTDSETAIKLNPYRDTYRIGLAQILLAQANREANKPAAANEADKKAQIAKLSDYIQLSIAAARSATDLARENVANWEALGSIYRGTALFARDAEQWVIKSFQEAIVRERNNPALYTELGKAYLISANRNKQAAVSAEAATKSKLEAEAADLLNKAMTQFDQAIKLKANYTPAHFNQALALEAQGKMDSAIEKLESMRKYNPQDIDVLYELGSLYYNKEAYTKAQDVFATITSLVPNHANAHYGLALVYQKTGDNEKAIQQLEKVLQLNPGNEQVQKQLDGLKNNVINNPTTNNEPKK